MWRNIFEGIGSFFEWSFGIIEFLGDYANYLFMVTIAVAFFYWLGQMIKQQKAGEN